MIDDEVGYTRVPSEGSQTSQKPFYAPSRFESLVRSILKHASGEMSELMRPRFLHLDFTPCAHRGQTPPPLYIVSYRQSNINLL